MQYHPLLNLSLTVLAVRYSYSTHQKILWTEGHLVCYSTDVYPFDHSFLQSFSFLSSQFSVLRFTKTPTAARSSSPPILQSSTPLAPHPRAIAE